MTRCYDLQNELQNAQPQHPPSDDLSVIAENPEDEEPVRQENPGNEVTPFDDGGMDDQQIQDEGLFIDDMSNSDSDEELEDMYDYNCNIY